MAEALNIKHGTLLGFSHNVVDFGSDFRFGVRKVITVQIAELDCGGKSEEGSIGGQAKALDDLAATKDYVKLTLNGHEFEEEYQLVSFSIDEGNWQTVTQGSITLESYTKGFVSFEEEDSDYAGWSQIDLEKDWRLMEEFSDDFEFERGANSISYTHDVSIKFSALRDGEGITPPLGAGLEIAKGLVDKADSRPDFQWLVETELQDLYSDIGPTYKRFITESVDEINSVVKVSENFSAQNIKGGSAGDYSFSATQSVDINEKGIINVTEKGKVIGLLEDGPVRKFPETALENEIEEATKVGGRLEKVFDEHKNFWADLYECEEGIPDLVLNDSKSHLLLLEKGVLRDFFRGSANYTVKGTNDQKLKDQSIHEFVSTIEALEYDSSAKKRSYLKSSQRGTFTGGSSENKIPEGGGEEDRPRFKEAMEDWDKNRNDIKKKLRQCVGVFPAGYSSEISTTYSPYKGSVGYSLAYSNEPKYGTTSTDYKLWTKEYTDAKNADGENCVFQNTIQNVVNHPQAIQLVQKRNTTELPSANASHRMVGKRSATLQKLTNAMIGEVDLKDMGDGGNNSNPNPKKLKTASYTFNNHNDKILSVSFSWE